MALTSTPFGDEKKKVQDAIDTSQTPTISDTKPVTTDDAVGLFKDAIVDTNFGKGADTVKAPQIGTGGAVQGNVGDLPGSQVAVNPAFEAEQVGQQGPVTAIKGTVDQGTPSATGVITGGATTTVPGATPGTTGIPEVDAGLEKVREDKAKATEDTINSFNLARGEFERNKGFYKNFDGVNNQFDGVLDDLRKVQTEQGVTDLSEEQLRVIAAKNGVTIDQVRDPTSIFNALELTPEGEDKFGVTGVKGSIENLETQFERRKEDLKFQLEGQRTNLNNQIQDVKRQVDRNVKFGEAQGAFSGAGRSSGFQEGLDRIQSDGDRTVSRLENLLDRVNDADETNVARLTEDYEKATAEASNQLSNQMQAIKFDTGLQMNTLQGKFGVGTEELTNALDNIAEEFGVKSMAVFNDYVTNMRAVQQFTFDNIEQQERINTIQEQRGNRRFDELLANNGALLQNTNLTSLANSVERGELSVQGFRDASNLIQSSIIDTLGDFGLVNTADISTITSLLEQGATPQQVVARMRELDKFSGVSQADALTGKDKFLNVGGRLFDVTTESFVDDAKTGGRRVEDTFKIGDNTLVQYSDGSQQTFNQSGDIVSTASQNIGDIDFSTNQEIINQFPREASFKNNNPAGITFGITQRTQSLLDNAGIETSLGTARPANEGGNYIKFKNAEDGVLAQKILLSQAGSDDINARLQQWVGTAEGPTYANDLMNQAGIENGTKFSELSDSQLDTLVAVQMRRESPNFFNKLGELSAESDQEQEVVFSPLAQAIADGDAVLGDFTASEKANITQELKEGGFFDRPESGNTRFQDLKTTDRQDLVGLSNMIDRINTLRDLKSKVDTGSVSARKERAKTIAGKGDPDFIKLDQISGKNLSEFIKQISGAAVTEQEAARLGKLVPTANMQDNEFDIALDEFEKEYTNVINSKLREFGFDNIEDFQKGLGVTSDEVTGTEAEERLQDIGSSSSLGSTSAGIGAGIGFRDTSSNRTEADEIQVFDNLY